MDEFPGLLARDFGFRPQGKAAPMSASKGGNSTISGVNLGTGSGGTVRSSIGSFAVDHDGLFGPASGLNQQDYGGLGGFGGGRSSSSSSSFAYDAIFQGSKDSGRSASLPVYDKPVYDDDIFDGVPGMKSSSTMKYDDVFNSMSSPTDNAAFEDLLGNFGRAETETKGSIGKKPSEREKDVPGFDDLIPGFGGTSPPQKRETSEPNRPNQSTTPATKSTSSVLEDPFVVLESTSVPSYSSQGLFTDPLDHISNLSNSGSTKVDGSSVSGGAFDDINAFDGFTKSVPLFSSEMNNNAKDKSPLRRGQNMGSAPGKEPTEKPSMKTFENVVHQKVPGDNYQRSHQILFDTPTGRGIYRPSEGSSVPYDTSQVDVPSKTNENSESAEDIWLTVVQIPLFTQPTSAPPPSRPPPPLFSKSATVSKADKGSFSGSNVKRRVNSSFPTSTQNYHIPKPVSDSVKNSGVSSIDELEDFAMGKPRTYADEHADVLSSEEEIDTNSAAAASAAAMEAMGRAEAKLKQAREIREREKARQGREERTVRDAQEREHKEKQEMLDHERELRDKEEKEREQKRLERERERQREIEREREKARHAVERATKEARDRAATEARLRAERAAVDKANAAARERAERAAVQRAAAEARERAAADARERAEKAATEARERAAAEARERAAAEAREKAATEARERAAVERAAAEVRLRAERAAVDRVTAEARERAATVAREKLQKTENDLESFFGMGARPNSAPRQRAGTSDPAFDTQHQNKGTFEGARRTSVGTSSNIRKTSSATNIVDDLSSIFGAAPSSGDFQEVEGETEERRRARLERHQRMRERAAKALAEKNERDIQVQRDQAERHRIAETLDVEIKRWAAGKEGNLRALLSTLQYVLWPECGWQAVSLTDLITSASVKKVYRKATLCIHPDKVQQKGANLQQKYIAEKVFDILKESWNKFNSEELF